MPTTLYKAFQAEVSRDVSGERTLWAVASLEEPDREGDVILADGWELENYRNNPVILFAHKYDQPPVAKAVEVAVSGKKLRFKAQFPSRREYPFADSIYRLYRGGYLRGFSVGFLPKLWGDKKSVAGEATRGRLFKRQELVEISVVPIPTQPRALMEAQRKGVVGQEEVKLFQDIAGSLEDLKAERETILRLETILNGIKDLGTRATISQEEAKAIVEGAIAKSLCGACKGE